MSDEDRLRDRLHQQVAEVPIVSDLDDVAARINRPRRRPNRTRPLALAAVGGLVVGGLIVVAAERAGHHDSSAVRVAGSPDPSAAPNVVTTLPPGYSQNGPTGNTSPGLSPGLPTGPPGGTGVSFVPGAVPATTVPPNELPTKGELPGVSRQVLPAPGEQPADAEAARSAVSQAVANAMDGAASNDTHAEAIEGGASLLPVFQQLRSGQFGPQVNEAKTVVMGVVFVTPARAVAQFRSDLAGGSISGPYVVGVIRNEQGWQVAREDYCRLIVPAGVTCP